MESLPVSIYQKVRNKVSASLHPTEKQLYQIMTPLSGSLNFTLPEMLDFRDIPGEGEEALENLQKAFDFAMRSNRLLYDLEFPFEASVYLNDICNRFYQEALLAQQDESFIHNFRSSRDLFVKAERDNLGSPGREMFHWTAPSPIQWNKIDLNESEVKQLRTEALEFYRGFGDEWFDEIKGELDMALYKNISFEWGALDVTRYWIDPQLLKSRSWKFRNDPQALYRVEDDEIGLVYPMSYYLIKSNFTTKPFPAAPPPKAGGATPPVVKPPAVVVPATPPVVKPASTGVVVKSYNVAKKNLFMLNLFNQVKKRGPVVPVVTKPGARSAAPVAAPAYHLAAIKCWRLPVRPNPAPDATFKALELLDLPPL